MDAVLRGMCIYTVLLVIFRISGKRTLAQITTFDFVLLLIISETTQQALLGSDFSFTGAFLLIVTLVALDIILSLCKQRFPFIRKLVDSVPVILVKDGQLLQDRADKERVGIDEVLSYARGSQGLERMEQIKYAVLEQNGEITVIPKESK